MTRILTEWAPYYLYGLEKGDHTIEIELLDPKNALAVGSYNRIKRTISIQ